MSYIKIDMNGIVAKRCANLKSRFLGGVTEASARKEIEKPLKRFILKRTTKPSWKFKD